MLKTLRNPQFMLNAAQFSMPLIAAAYGGRLTEGLQGRGLLSR